MKGRKRTSGPSLNPLEDARALALVYERLDHMYVVAYPSKPHDARLFEASKDDLTFRDLGVQVLAALARHRRRADPDPSSIPAADIRDRRAFLDSVADAKRMVVVADFNGHSFDIEALDLFAKNDWIGTGHVLALHDPFDAHLLGVFVFLALQRSNRTDLRARLRRAKRRFDERRR